MLKKHDYWGVGVLVLGMSAGLGVTYGGFLKSIKSCLPASYTDDSWIATQTANFVPSLDGNIAAVTRYLDQLPLFSAERDVLSTALSKHKNRLSKRERVHGPKDCIMPLLVEENTITLIFSSRCLLSKAQVPPNTAQGLNQSERIFFDFPENPLNYTPCLLPVAPNLNESFQRLETYEASKKHAICDILQHGVIGKRTIDALKAMFKEDSDEINRIRKFLAKNILKRVCEIVQQHKKAIYFIRATLLPGFLDELSEASDLPIRISQSDSILMGIYKANKPKS